MASPIQNRIGQVFVPVSDMGRAVRWYSTLFGLPKGDTSYEGMIYDIPMSGETRLALDATRKQVVNSSQPLCFLWTADIHEAYTFLKQHELRC